MRPHKRGTGNRIGKSIGRIRDRVSWDSADRGLTRLLDLGIASVIFIAPLFMGGRHPVGRLVYITLICLTAMVWAARQVCRPRATWQWSGIEWLIIAGMGLLVLQLAQLPQAWLTAISPHLPEFLPLWFNGDPSVGLGTWSQLSLYPEATRNALVMFMAYAVFFLVLVQRIESIEDIEWLFRWIALSAVVMATIGILQMLVGNGKFLWVYHHPWRDTNGIVKGPFACQNHFAHLLAIGVVPLIWWIQHVLNGEADELNSGGQQPAGRTNSSEARRSQSNRRSPENKAWSTSRASKRTGDRSLSLLLIGIGVVALACLLTFSRGGVLVIFLAAGGCVASYFFMSLLGRKSLLAIAGVAVALAIALFIFGYDQLADEFESFATVSLDEMDSGGTRRELWGADLKTFQKFSILGTGVGSHAEVYPVHFERNLDVELEYAESGYIQLLMETGIAGVTLFAVALAFILYWCTAVFRGTRSKRIRSILFAIAAVLLASLTQSIWDFVWYIPACLILTLALIACLCRLRQITTSLSQTQVSHDEGEPLPSQQVSLRPLWMAGAVLVTVTSFQMISVPIPGALGSSQWDAYKIAIHAAKSQPDASKEQAIVLSTLPALKTAASRDSKNGRVHLKLAAVYALQFDVAQQTALNPMTLDEIRNAALAAGFANLDEQNQWLERAIGENCKYLHLSYRHARQAASLTPFQGEAYIHLTRLGFLYDSPRVASNELMRQALLVRPHHGLVLLTAGLEAARSGDVPGTVEYFRRAFQKGREHQQRVIDMLAANISVQVFLDEFDPDLEGLGLLIDFYRRSGRAEELREILPRYVELLNQESVEDGGIVQATNWLRGYSAYKLLAENEPALRCVQRAVESAPDHVGANVAFAKELIDARQFDEAIRHLRKCMYDRPDASELKQLLVLARTQQVNRR